MMGYPFGRYDKYNNLPITRVGYLSSPFKVPFDGNPYMLGDVETNEGMSGGPVLMDIRDFTKIGDNKLEATFGTRKVLLIGVNSGQIRFPLNEPRSNLITIWFPELITDIIEARSLNSWF